MKKALSIIMALAMVLVMAIPSFASNTTISTVVPDEHTVTVVYNDGGYVLVNFALVVHNLRLTDLVKSTLVQFSKMVIILIPLKLTALM